MARIASKKSVKKASVIPFSFSVSDKDIIERQNFGAFEIVLFKKGIMYKNYTGYHVFFTPYTVGQDGQAHETSSYNFLVNLLNSAKAIKGHEEEPFDADSSVTKGDILQSEIIITEAVLSHPMTAFIDLDYATEFANKHMQWLNEMTEKLSAAIGDTPEEEDAEAQKKNLEHDAKVIAMEQLTQEINNNKK